MSRLREVEENIEQRLRGFYPDHTKRISHLGIYFENIPPPIESWTRVRNPLRTIYNATLLELSKYIPSPRIKNRIFRHLGIKIGEHSTVAPRVQFDYFYPELIEIGDYCVIGDGARLWTHDFGINYFAISELTIGDNVVIGSEAILAASNIPTNSKIRLRDILIGKK